MPGSAAVDHEFLSSEARLRPDLTQLGLEVHGLTLPDRADSTEANFYGPPLMGYSSRRVGELRILLENIRFSGYASWRGRGLDPRGRKDS